MRARARSLVWSGKYEDSAWCKEEFAKLETMQNAMKGFRYVIAPHRRLGDLRGLASTKLWIDFAKQPEGPGAAGVAVVVEPDCSSSHCRPLP